MLGLFMAGALSVTSPVEVHVEVVSEPAALRRGLQGHRPLAAGEGMLFVLPAPEQARFWMRDMTFPIDIVFVAADGKVDALAADAPPCTTAACAIYHSRGEVTHVLEMPAGFAKRHAIEPGKTLHIDLSRGSVRVR